MYRAITVSEGSGEARSLTGKEACGVGAESLVWVAGEEVAEVCAPGTLSEDVRSVDAQEPVNRLAAREDERGQQVAVLALLQETQPKSTLLTEGKSVELNKGIGIACETVLCDVGLDTRIDRGIARERIGDDAIAFRGAKLIAAYPGLLP